ncbi:hypothetical protein [Klebsiella aerogenes]|uniref:hypothetical protein n=1 Tax=Klebsiella aerogenes TaxID=548 RepID=UPI00280FD1D4|nr:hypothetical protein [Klebsiella aerogenes]MDQ8573710.1 hypothetical protein [Klebsiella aerogenes]MDQ8596604.1 hypothetical protein [Klebsiella aerogenes]
MLRMTPFEFVISAAIFMMALTIFMAFMYYTMQKNRESRYNEEKKKIELDLLRHNVEAEIYNLNERLTKTSSRFEDSFHLQLQGNENSLSNKTSKIILNDFLKSSGIKQSDLEEKDFVFVLTPFHKDFDSVYQTIKAVCDKADIRCIRGDEQNFKSDIFSHVLRNIVQAKVIVANIGGRNPNVLYELGISHALDKTTILISKMTDDLPVDLKSKRIVTYKDVSDLNNTLPVELLKAMK